jgi:transcriptional/translational regulatory protein YebC/TACO1
MGRQWLHAKREVANLKKGQVVGKLVKEMMVAAKLGGPDIEGNARLYAAVEKARKASVTRDVIERAIKKGAGVGDEKLHPGNSRLRGIRAAQGSRDRRSAHRQCEPHGPGNASALQKGQLGTAGSNKFLFDHLGIVEAHHPDASIDPEEAAIEAGANDFVLLEEGENDDIPAGTKGVKFLTERTATAAVSKWLAKHGWTVVTSELGYIAKQFPQLNDEQRTEVGEFLQALEDNDDVHRVWAALK